MTVATVTKSDLTPARRWAGRVLVALPALAMGMSASMKLTHAASFVTQWTDKLGFRESALSPIGVLELLCLLVYAVPRTRFVGAVLVTAYLGGATVTHVRVGDPFLAPVVLGVMVWAGMYLSDRRLHPLVTGARPA